LKNNGADMNVRIAVTFFLTLFLCITVSSAQGVTNTSKLGNNVVTSTINNRLKEDASIVSSTEIKSAMTPVADNKQLVVVSKTPEFFTYTLTAISIVISAVTLLIGVLTGIAFTFILNVNKERKGLDAIRETIRKQQEEVTKNIKEKYEQIDEYLKQTIYGLSTVHNAKAEISSLLLQDTPVFDQVYKAVEKTTRFPDEECIRLYAKVLLKYEDKIDMVRLVRNGLLAYARNPQTGLIC
jgi:hypothetical protein